MNEEKGTEREREREKEEEERGGRDGEVREGGRERRLETWEMEEQKNNL